MHGAITPTLGADVARKGVARIRSCGRKSCGAYSYMVTSVLCCGFWNGAAAAFWLQRLAVRRTARGAADEPAEATARPGCGRLTGVRGRAVG
jgi:hypothetical protein